MGKLVKILPTSARKYLASTTCAKNYTIDEGFGPRINVQIWHIEDKEDDEKKIYLRFSKEDVFWTIPDRAGLRTLLAGNSNFVTGQRGVNMRKTMGH